MTIIEFHQGCPFESPKCYGPVGDFYTIFGTQLNFTYLLRRLQRLGAKLFQEQEVFSNQDHTERIYNFLQSPQEHPLDSQELAQVKNIFSTLKEYVWSGLRGHDGKV